MIRICHVQVLPIVSGAQRVMLDIFKQLDRARYEIHVACQKRGPLTDTLEQDGIRWHAVPALDRAIRPYKDWQGYRQLSRLFHEQKFDLVHTHSSKPGVLGRVAARRAGVPLVLHTVHGFAFHEFSSAAKRWFYSRLERWAGTYCDRVLFVNHEEHQMSVDRGWLPAAKCQTIYNGVDLAAMDPARSAAARREYRRSWRLDDDEIAIYFAGRFEPQKQPLLLPQIARELAGRRTRRPWKLIVAGDGPAREQLEARIEEYRMNDVISLVGWQKNPHAALAAADVALLPSLFEGLPLTLIEAQGAGLPIVASNVKGNREVVTPATGFLCPARDPGAYAEKLALLVDDPISRARLGRAAREHAEQEFDTVVNSGRVAAIYDDMFGGGTFGMREVARVNRPAQASAA
jgi:glycosyltransferase involved in cell wall biosynthesis